MNNARTLRLACAALLALTTACVTQAPLPSDRDMVLRIDHLALYGVALPRDVAAYERLERERWIDGSVMITYEFDPPEGSNLPYLYSTAERHPSSADACMSFHAGNLGLGLASAEIVERDDLFRWGDRSRFGVLVHEGEPIGNVFGMCRGRNAFLVVVGGFTSEDPELWADLLGPLMRAHAEME